MTKMRKTWVYSPPKPPKPEVPETVKTEVETKADVGFARLEYIGGLGRQNRFNMAYMRHTGKWFEIRQDLSLDQCLAEVKDGGPFQP